MKLGKKDTLQPNRIPDAWLFLQCIQRRDKMTANHLEDCSRKSVLALSSSSSTSSSGRQAAGCGGPCRTLRATFLLAPCSAQRGQGQVKTGAGGIEQSSRVEALERGWTVCPLLPT